jgi:hypothetical protein
MGMEYRWGRRQETNIPVYFFALPVTRGEGRLLDISCSGAWLETSICLRLRTLLYLESLDDDAPAGSRTAASVVRRTPRGVGLEWCEKDGLFQRRLFVPPPEGNCVALATSHLMRRKIHAA